MNVPLRVMTNDNGMEYCSQEIWMNNGRKGYSASIRWYGSLQLLRYFPTVADTLAWFRQHGLKGKDRQVDQYGRVLCAR